MMWLAILALLAKPLSLSASANALTINDQLFGKCAIISLPAPPRPAGPDTLSVSTPAGDVLIRLQSGAEVIISVRSATGQPVAIRWPVLLRWGRDTYPCRLDPPKQGADVLQVRVGDAATALCNALYNRYKDRALKISGHITFTGMARGAVRAVAECTARRDWEPLAAFRVIDDFYRTKRGIKYFAPIDKSVFRRPQAGWCSWYYFYRRVTEDDVVRNARWLGENLRKFGVIWVQIDDGWQARGTAESRCWRDWRSTDPDFPHGMKWLADQIRACGLKAGLWLTPFGTNAADIARQHPDWFVQDRPGHFFDSGWIGRYLIDPTNDLARYELIENLFLTMSRKWGYDYFKIDGQPATAEFYRRLHGRLSKKVPGEQAYRLGLQAIRRAIGPQRFLLGCWGTPLEGIGFFNGSRTGGDVSARWRGMRPAIAATCRWFFLHNVVWYSDPDCLCVRPPLTLDQATVWATLLGLTGQHLMLSDDMPALPAERVELLKRILPPADTYPMDLYSLPRLSAIHLRAGIAGHAWSVVALFNWDEQKPLAAALDPAKLGLPHLPYIAYDFWARRCLGIITGPTDILIPPTACAVIGLRPADNLPALAGIDRHITQGAVSLRHLTRQARARWVAIRGASQLIPGEPYTLAFATGRDWKCSGAGATGKTDVELESSGGAAFLTLRNPRGGLVRWWVKFQPAQPHANASSKLKIIADPVGRRITLTLQGPPGTHFFLIRGAGISARTTRTTLTFRLNPGRYTFLARACDAVGNPLTGWARAVVDFTHPVTVPTPDVYLSDLNPKHVHQQWGKLRFDRSVENHPIRIAGCTFKKGLGSHANSVIVYDLGGRSGKLVGWCGLDDEKPTGTVTFRIYIDGKLRFETGVMTGGDEPEGFVIPFKNAHELRLVITDAGDGTSCDHADWADIGIIWQD